MKKRKIERAELSRAYLIDLLTPFLPMKEIIDISINKDKIVIEYVKEGGVINTS
jgi:hypothetical protein